MSASNIKKVIETLERYENEGVIDVVISNLKVKKTMPTTADVTLTFPGDRKIVRHFVEYDIYGRGTC